MAMRPDTGLGVARHRVRAEAAFDLFHSPAGLQRTRRVRNDHRPAGSALTGDHMRLTKADISAAVAAAQEGETP
ncbi:hypothetical protein [Dinoroseobacter sp. S124A]|uniref:hypothetical protein n=1 Tax=Dinoroseobacter sp. S124A TaxID=3415128 RepID=UPI003C7DA7B5